MPLPSAQPEKPKTTNVDVYQLVSDTPGYKFFAIAFPLGQRPVRAFNDTKEGAIGHVKKLLAIE